MSNDQEMDDFFMLKICANCASFFAEGHVVSEDTYGLCLQEYDDELEPFIDDIMNGKINNIRCELLEKYKVLGNHSCNNFESSMPVEGDALPEAMTVDDALSLIIDKVDWSEQPVEQYKNALRSSCVNSQEKAMSALGGLVAMHNTEAFDMLFDYLMSLVPSLNIEMTKLMVDILKNLQPYQNREKLIEPLIDTLFKTESNNQTRGWYKAVFEFLACCDLKESEKYLQRMKASNHFSYRIKKKIDAILLRENRFF